MDLKLSLIGSQVLTSSVLHRGREKVGGKVGGVKDKLWQQQGEVETST